jgi:hypothetical protein
LAGAEVRIGDDLEALLELGEAQEPAVGRPSENGVLPRAELPGATLGRPASTVDRPDEAQEELILDLSDESSSAAEIDTG